MGPSRAGKTRGLCSGREILYSPILFRQTCKIQEHMQDLSLGLFRSDYMLQIRDRDETIPSSSLKQVEFNTYSAAGGVHSSIVADMHHYFTRTGVYERLQTVHGSSPITAPSLPANNTTRALAAGLVTAHHQYGPAKSDVTSHTGILVVVQPNTINTCDERPIEYMLGDMETPVLSYRLSFGEDVLARTYLTPTRELIYHSPSSHAASGVEISVVYMRAG